MSTNRPACAARQPIRITARRNSRSFAAPQKIPAAKQRLPAAVPSPHSAAAFPHASALCIRPSHSLPALKIPLKIDPLCFMPAPDCAPRTARQNRASFRGPFPHFKRHGKRPASAKSRPLPNAENDRRCRLRPPSPKFCRFTFAQPAPVFSPHFPSSPHEFPGPPSPPRQWPSRFPAALQRWFPQTSAAPHVSR